MIPRLLAANIHILGLLNDKYFDFVQQIVSEMFKVKPLKSQVSRSKIAEIQDCSYLQKLKTILCNDFLW